MRQEAEILNKHRMYGYGAAVGVTIGVFLSYGGFTLWYRRLQRYQG